MNAVMVAVAHLFRILSTAVNFIIHAILVTMGRAARQDVLHLSSGSDNVQDEVVLLRPQTEGIPSPCDDNIQLVFFNAFFCPYCQMVWIALNEKGAQHKTEFVEGLTIRGGQYEVHPRLKALGRKMVPTLYVPATDTIIDYSTQCVEFVDNDVLFLNNVDMNDNDDNDKQTPTKLIPENPKDRTKAKLCEELLHGIFTYPFFAMLLHQDPKQQEQDKEELLSAIEELTEDYKGPYYLGDTFSVADIAMAPYFDHMIVLEHYRNFKVPLDDDEAYDKWHEWRNNVLKRPSVAATRQDPQRIIEAYKRYAECYVRSNWYYRVFGHR